MLNMGGGHDATEVAHLCIPAVYKPHSQAVRRKPDYEKIDIYTLRMQWYLALA